MAALKLTLNSTSLMLMQRVLMTKHHQKWQLERAHTVLGRAALAGRYKSSDTLLMVKVYALILISIVFTHDDRMKHVRSVIIKAARAKTKLNFCPAHV